MYLETLLMNLLVLEACHEISNSWKNLVPDFTRLPLYDEDTSDAAILEQIGQL